MKPIIKTQDEIMKETIEETAKRVAKEFDTSKTLTEDAVKKAVKEALEFSNSTNTSAITNSNDTGESKISKILKNANLQQQSETNNDIIKRQFEEISEERKKLEHEKNHIHSHSNVSEDTISCPNCKKEGHSL